MTSDLDFDFMTSEYDFLSNQLNTKVGYFLSDKDVAGLAAMIDAGLDVNHVNASNHSLIYWSVLDSDKPEMVRMLIGRGANVEHRSHRTPLSMAISLNHFGAVAALLDGGAHPDAIDHVGVGGKLPLCYAMCEDSTPSLRLLLQANASLDYFDEVMGVPALHQCIKNNSPQALTVLLEFGQDPRKTDFANHENALEYAARINGSSPIENRSEIIRVLTAWTDCQAAQDAVDEVMKNAGPAIKDAQDQSSDEPKEPKKRGARP